MRVGPDTRDEPLNKIRTIAHKVGKANVVGRLARGSQVRKARRMLSR